MNDDREKQIEEFFHEIAEKGKSQEVAKKIVHPTVDLLIDLEQGFLSEEDSVKLYDHIAFCEHCSKILTNIRKSISEDEGEVEKENIYEKLKELAHSIKEKISLSSLPKPTPSPFAFASKRSVLARPTEEILELAGLEDSDLNYTLECLERASKRIQDKVDLDDFIGLVKEEAEKMDLKDKEIKKVIDFVETITS